jgi:hypothetical protein
LWSVENLNRREILLEVEHVKSSDARLQGAVFRWLPKLAKIEGWEDWKRQVTGSTMWFDDPWPSDEEAVGDFKLPEDLDLQHAVVVKYFALHSTLVSLRDCEYYFRRYPFGGLPVQRHDHLRYICEMYFGRFYEFKERSKECFKAINATLPAKKKLDPGSLIKVFDKEFRQEIRERNGVHHHDRFEDITIDNLFLLTMMSRNLKADKEWKRRTETAYRRSSKVWANRVVDQSKRVEVYLNIIAKTILLHCPFLAELAEPAKDG